MTANDQQVTDRFCCGDSVEQIARDLGQKVAQVENSLRAVLTALQNEKAKRS